MHTLLRYLRPYWGLVLLALLLAAINQIFSLLDPLIFRHVIDSYATRYHEYTTRRVLPRRRRCCWRGGRRGLRLARGEELPGLLHQRHHAAPGRAALRRRHPAFARPALSRSFEDQRSGETLGKLQKVRTDVERLITASINMLFTTLVGIVFVMVYAFSVHWSIAPAYFLTVPLLGRPELGAEQRIKTMQKVIVAETTALAGVDHGVAAQHRAGQEPRPRRSRR